MITWLSEFIWYKQYIHIQGSYKEGQFIYFILKGGFPFSNQIIGESISVNYVKSKTKDSKGQAVRAAVWMKQAGERNKPLILLFNHSSATRSQGSYRILKIGKGTFITEFWRVFVWSHGHQTSRARRASASHKVRPYLRKYLRSWHLKSSVSPATLPPTGWWQRMGQPSMQNESCPAFISTLFVTEQQMVSHAHIFSDTHTAAPWGENLASCPRLSAISHSHFFNASIGIPF